MRYLEEKIRREGVMLSADILKVDGFLNHRLDVECLCELGREFYRLYGDAGVNKIVTIEASGIALAVTTAIPFGVPAVFAKKSKSSNISNDVHSTMIHSFTHGCDYNVVIAKEYLSPADRVLIVDDFLAEGNALRGLIRLVEGAGATVVGCGVAVEKKFQGGGDALRAAGYRVESLAKIAAMTESEITFAD